MRAMDGWVGIDRHTEAGWRQACEEAHQRYHSGRFLIERLGAERFLEPHLMAICGNSGRRLSTNMLRIRPATDAD